METVLNWGYGIYMIEKTEIEVPDPDVRLMLRFKEGDAEAFELLFSRHTRAMVNFAYRFVRNRELAEELAQEIFLRVYEGAAAYKAQARFTTWLYRIATNVCLNEIRKPHFRVALQSLTTGRTRDGETVPIDVETESEPDKHLEQQAISRALKQALDQIPDKQRIAFILNKYQELSYAEVSEIMKISEKAAKSLIHRAKEALAEKLKPLLPELLNI
jgi:RNA polymerase sigma-70 factor (ECF subfamily)